MKFLSLFYTFVIEKKNINIIVSIYYLHITHNHISFRMSDLLVGQKHYLNHMMSKVHIFNA
jgi:hypothetical protein